MKVTLERIISDELEREMSLDEGTFAGLDDRDSDNQFCQMGIAHADFINKVHEMMFPKGVIDSFATRDVDNTKMCKSRKEPCIDLSGDLYRQTVKM